MAVNYSCLEFANDGGYVSISDEDQTGLDFTGSFTVAWWQNFGDARLSGGGGLESIILSKLDINGGYEIGFLGVAGNGTSFIVRLREDSSTIDTIQFSGTELGKDNWLWNSSLIDGRWAHVAIRVDYSGGNPAVSLFTNGNKVDTDTGSNTSAIGTNSAEFAVGAKSGGPSGNSFNVGETRLDELKVWDAALPDDMIVELMRENIAQSALQGYWNFNEQLWDSSGNNNDLTSAVGTQSFEIDLPFITYGRTVRYRAGAGDGTVGNTDNGWSTTRDASSGDSVNDTGTSMAVEASASTFSPENVQRAFISLGTSGQGSEGTILDAYLKLTLS